MRLCENSDGWWIWPVKQLATEAVCPHTQRRYGYRGEWAALSHWPQGPEPWEPGDSTCQKFGHNWEASPLSYVYKAFTVSLLSRFAVFQFFISMVYCLHSPQLLLYPDSAGVFLSISTRGHFPQPSLSPSILLSGKFCSHWLLFSHWLLLLTVAHGNMDIWGIIEH